MKKMNYIFNLMAGAVLLLSAYACSREEIDAPASEKPAAKTEFRLGIADTKTSLGESEEGQRKVYWSSGDKVAINGIASDELSEVGEEVSSAVFTFDEAPVAPFNVIYPAGIYKDASTVTLPAYQTWKQGTFDDGMFPMAGYSATGLDATMDYLCATLKISILKDNGETPDEDNIRVVSFEGLGGERISGDFTIDYQAGTLTPVASPSDADKKVSVALNQSLSTDTALDVFIVVPAMNYSQGFSITVQDSQGHIMTKTGYTTNGKELEAGKLYTLPEFRFIPSGEATGIEIWTAEDLIAFATAYNNREYDALGSGLIATVMDDLTFDATTSAAFSATGGIGLKKNIHGSEDYYFGGTLNGNGKTISGLAATVPIFTATGVAGKVLDLTLDDTCSYTFTHHNATQGQYGAVVGYHKGLLKNVTVNAEMAMAACDVTQETCFGGIVGRVVEGVLDNCTFAGAIKVPADFSVTGKLTYIGGLVGSVTNAAGIIKDSAFNGTIDNQGRVSSTDSTSPYLIIGGIIGRNSGTVSNCTVANHGTGITVTLTDSSDHDYTGTIVTHSTLAYNYAIAGICGDNKGTVSGCTNRAIILNTFSSARGSNDVNGRYLQVGGIVGFNNAESGGVFECNNYGAIIDRANPKMHYVGGIVGRNYKGMVASCDNKSGANIGVGTSHASPYSVRQLKLGGVIGWNDGTGAVKNVHNAANLNVSRLENSTAVFSYIGGVIGQTTAAIDGSADGGSITNSGTISQTNGIGMIAAPTATLDQGIFLGGIVAHTTQAVKNVSNSGKITYTCTAVGVGAQYVQMGGVAGKVNASSSVDVEHCTNTANVTFVVSTDENTNASYASNNATRYYYNYLGGIVGYAKNVNIKGNASTKCTNSGVIKGGDGSANNNQPSPSFTIGGIVGYITGESSISYCALTGSGQSYNDHWSNRTALFQAPACGGIAGHIFGTSESPVSLTNCEVASTATVTGRRGSLGGIVGIAQYAEISSCSVPINFTGSGYYYGGIAGQAQYAAISASSYTGTSIQSSQLSKGGGIVGDLQAGSTIDGCSSSASTINKNGTAVNATGGIAGTSVAGATIQNCHYTSAIGKICGDSNFTDGGGNAADL